MGRSHSPRPVPLDEDDDDDEEEDGAPLPDTTRGVSPPREVTPVPVPVPPRMALVFNRAGSSHSLSLAPIPLRDGARLLLLLRLLLTLLFVPLALLS